MTPDVSPDDVIADHETRSARDEAVEWLRALLAAGPVAAKDAQRQAREVGIADRTLKRAKLTAGVISEQDRDDGGSQRLDVATTGPFIYLWPSWHCWPSWPSRQGGQRGQGSQQGHPYRREQPRGARPRFRSYTTVKFMLWRHEPAPIPTGAKRSSCRASCASRLRTLPTATTAAWPRRSDTHCANTSRPHRSSLVATLSEPTVEATAIQVDAEARLAELVAVREVLLPDQDDPLVLSDRWSAARALRADRSMGWVT